MATTLPAFLAADKDALAFFQQLAPSYRRRYETWVAAAANPAAQQVRLVHALAT
ncbi:YdeI/OmpD-associated family protein [Lacticaseibacillus zhaodongensis]|uniref:YdeI/OmpD-associated family protein n=1 Tax=Lacticaseibacillus zhaodongensis TaxID=2668065 RepID=UPI0012D34488|nr:YdeI/OmpD-associated family protein [Lacticaseibacillus zhaodongensis]